MLMLTQLTTFCRTQLVSLQGDVDGKWEANLPFLDICEFFPIFSCFNPPKSTEYDRAGRWRIFLGDFLEPHIVHQESIDLAATTLETLGICNQLGKFWILTVE